MFLARRRCQPQDLYTWLHLLYDYLAIMRICKQIARETADLFYRLHRVSIPRVYAYNVRITLTPGGQTRRDSVQGVDGDEQREMILDSQGIRGRSLWHYFNDRDEGNEYYLCPTEQLMLEAGALTSEADKEISAEQVTFEPYMYQVGS